MVNLIQKKTRFILIFKICFIGVIILIMNMYVCAQNYTISGTVEDIESGEKLLGANIYNGLTTNQGTISNIYGFYSLTIPKGEVQLVASYVGYKPVKINLSLTSDTIINLKLVPNVLLEEIAIIGNRIEKNVESTQMGQINIPIKTIKALPVLLGETDILKTIQLLPGVQSGTEGTSGFYVRGGAPDQNLILLDGVPVYNVNHLFGFFSVFNADAISSVNLIKGGFPAYYGGRLSSVLDIRMKEGNKNKFKAYGSIGLIASKLTLEGPFINEKTSFIISARRTYIDVLAQPFIKMSQNQNGLEKFNAGYYFSDINAKINHRLNDRMRLYYSIYTGKDKIYLNIEDKFDSGFSKEKLGIKWGNLTTSLRFNYKLSNKIFTNTTLTYSRYNFITSTEMRYEDVEYDESEFISVKYLSGIEDFGFRIDFDYYVSPKQTLKFGFNSIYHIFSPGVSTIKVDYNSDVNINKTLGNKDIFSYEYAVYLQDEFVFNENLKANLGIHYSGFYVQEKTYQSLQPRLSIRYLVTKNWSIKTAFSQMNQYILLLTNSTIGLPTDLWVPVTKKIKPQLSYQYALGTSFNLPDNYDFTIEGFYKTMNNIVEYKEGASFFQLSNTWEQKVTQGKAWSYGAEFLVEKKIGKTSGWIGYTLSWSERQFDDISNGKKFPYKYDRRHDISIALTHKFNDKVDVGLTWIFATGNAVTFGTQKYTLADEFGYNSYYFGSSAEYATYFEKRNNFRMPTYHRLDLGVNFHKMKRWGTRTFSLGVYNAYNRKNPFFVDVGYVDNEQKLIQYSLFPIIPSISYSFKFK